LTHCQSLSALDQVTLYNGQPAGCKELADLALSRIICGKRSLKTTDVQYVWAVKASEDELDETAIFDAEDILSARCKLVIIDKESIVIRLFRYTIRNISNVF